MAVKNSSEILIKVLKGISHTNKYIFISVAKGLGKGLTFHTKIITAPAEQWKGRDSSTGPLADLLAMDHRQVHWQIYWPWTIEPMQWEFWTPWVKKKEHWPLFFRGAVSCTWAFFAASWPWPWPCSSRKVTDLELLEDLWKRMNPTALFIINIRPISHVTNKHKKSDLDQTRTGHENTISFINYNI